MRTSQKLWLGFGVLTGLLVLTGLAILARLQSIESNIKELSEVSRPRSVAATELEINVINFALAIHTYLQTDDPRFRQEALDSVAAIDHYLANYERLTATDQQRELASRFRGMWQELRGFGQTLLDGSGRPITPQDSQRLATLRIRLETLLDDEMQVEAVESYDTRQHAALREMQTILGFVVTLLLIGVTIAILTSFAVGPGVVRTEQALRESDQRFRTLADAMPQLIWTAEPDGTVDYYNARVQQFDGFTFDDQAKRWRWNATLHPEDQAATLRAWTEAVASGHEYRVEHRVRMHETEGGGYRWFLSRGVPVRDDKGAILKWYGTATDIQATKEADQAVRESEKFTRRILDNLFAFVGVMTRDGTLIEANRAPLEAAGITAGDVIGRKFWDCYWWNYSPDVQAQLRDAVARALRGEIVRYDVPVRMAGDSRMWIDFQIAPLRDDEGHITHLIPSAMDIIARRHAEEALRESEARLRLALESAQAGTFDILLTPGVPPVVTDGLKKMFGFNPDAQPQLDEYVRSVHPEDIQRVAETIQYSAENGVGHYIEYRIKHADGNEIWVASRAEVISGEDGRAKRLIGAVLDITERVHASLELRRREEQLQVALSAGRMGTWVWDIATGTVTTDSLHRGLWDIEGDEARVPAEVIFSRVHPDDLHLVVTPERLAELTGPFDIELRVIRRNGEVRWLRGSAVPVYDIQGNVKEVIGVNFDITEPKRVEATLREADRLKDEFLATLAHELRNPLAPIRNAVQILNRKGPVDPTLQMARDMIDRQVQGMVRLIDDLMDVSRITRGKLELRQERVDLAAVIDQALETSRPLVEAAGHVLTVTLPAEPMPMEADLVRLAQVFSNLLNNAARYTETPGHIWLTAQRQGREVSVSVKDTGIGIPPDQLGRVFEMFSQVNRTRERSQGGLGVGLTLVKRLVEMHGGSVEAISEGPGQGSEFVVRLPVLIEAVQVAGELSLNGWKDAGAGRRILVVDDNPDIVETMVTLLEIDGHETYRAYDGLAAVEAAEQYRPEVVLLDIGLPKLSGLEACRRIREQPWGQQMVLVALTGWGQEEDRRKSREVGFDHHLVKPVGYKDLTSFLAALPEPNGQRRQA